MILFLLSFRDCCESFGKDKNCIQSLVGDSSANKKDHLEGFIEQFTDAPHIDNKPNTQSNNQINDIRSNEKSKRSYVKNNVQNGSAKRNVPTW